MLRKKNVTQEQILYFVCVKRIAAIENPKIAANYLVDLYCHLENIMPAIAQLIK